MQKENNSLKERQSEADLYYGRMKELEVYQAELVKMLNQIEEHGKKVVILFEGRDAAGKGSLIGTIVQYLNPKHCRTVALGKPSDEEKSQWYFQKYVKHFPRGGEIVLFDRSWYNRAMVEPIFGFCTYEEYKLFLDTVIPFEESLIKHGTHLIKIYLSVSKEIQKERFARRAVDPLRQWKLSEIDMQAQAMWNEFTQKKIKMLERTHAPQSPWHIIRSNNKHKARIEAMKLILRELEVEGLNPAIDLKADTDILVSVEDEILG
ncbi:MAG: polyphosphate kinase 2 [Sulfurovum sp. 28-43-6]|nr:MAG: polyphosphate kinase 2 [Sulfurovum sp. 35-42-20]OYY54871.1 MAG: polyphosphate kinase 2 [Sulfurovum sp. 28-43-6]OYZ25008.1 MAG: polyphosphate kinase 2 [Sulfurovum sp. 16-42-52]OYZ49651.1 MAG: polyphosphate kinase 2 [Sulfurovum sp. 24-42-9]OZA44919.1 MAG: polyphosphate kinase 2 [Sulfurovum sp. 17-42-90]OZA59801.1 MAG: polyphosphate kinase 2 [Sulfurovum sp. 39-42-12]